MLFKIGCKDNNYSQCTCSVTRIQRFFANCSEPLLKLIVMHTAENIADSPRAASCVIIYTVFRRKIDNTIDRLMIRNRHEVESIETTVPLEIGSQLQNIADATPS